MNVEPVIADSAYRHGIAAEDMRHALVHRLATYHNRHDGFAMVIGTAGNGTVLEVGYFRSQHYDLLIVHAMKARRKYRTLVFGEED